MAGHSKWANIKHRKERQDKKKGKVWSKCSRAIIAAARAGGPDPETNLALRYAIDEAKYENMPKDTIQRAVDKGAGAGAGDSYEEVPYEGYGPNGVAILVDALTDNRTRTVGEVRHIFSKHGGNLGNTGCVSFIFQTKGQILVDASSADEETLMEHALEAGAEDVEPPEPEDDDHPGYWTIVTDPSEFVAVRQRLEAAGVRIEQAHITKIPDNTVSLNAEDARKLLNLVEALEDNDDVQKVYTNADIPDDALAAAG